MLATTRIIHGHVIDALRGLPEASVQMAICSPPYWKLRAYGTPPQVWGGDPCCDHDWSGLGARSKGGLRAGSSEGAVAKKRTRARDESQVSSDGEACDKCGAWRGELGQEPTPSLFVEHLVLVAREVRRVLRPDGVFMVNLGDTYAARWSSMRPEGRQGLGSQERDRWAAPASMWADAGLKPKDLVGIPWKFAEAMVADGWWRRMELPWLKYNGMVASFRDRPTVSHEWFFGFAASERYYWDIDATRTPQKTLGERHEGKSGYREGHPSKGGIAERALHPDGAARRTGDWLAESIDIMAAQARAWADELDRVRRDQGLLQSPEGDPLAVIANIVPLKDEHFAAYPPRLIEPLILAGTSAKGCCPSCGAPWRRVVERERILTRPGNNSKVYRDPDSSPYEKHSGSIIGNRDPKRHITITRTKGWGPSCGCDAGEPVPCTVLDPFGGSGTTAEVANRHGRAAISVELGDDYVDIQRRRLGKVDLPLFGATAAVEGVA